MSLDELSEIAETISSNQAEKRIKEMILTGDKMPTKDDREQIKQILKETFIKQNKGRAFFETIQGELKNIPVAVKVNIKGKQRYMAQNADKITNVIREVIRNPQAFTQVPGIGKAFNQLLEESGMSPIDFTSMIEAVKQQPVEASSMQNITSSVGGEQLQEQK